MRYQDMPEDERALEFPVRFPVKAMGRARSDVRAALLSVLDSTHTLYREEDIREQVSRNGNFTSVTVVIQAESRSQLDDIYEQLADHPEVVMTL